MHSRRTRQNSRTKGRIGRRVRLAGEAAGVNQADLSAITSLDVAATERREMVTFEGAVLLLRRLGQRAEFLLRVQEVQLELTPEPHTQLNALLIERLERRLELRQLVSSYLPLINLANVAARHVQRLQGSDPARALEQLGVAVLVEPVANHSHVGLAGNVPCVVMREARRDLLNQSIERLLVAYGVEVKHLRLVRPSGAFSPFFRGAVLQGFERDPISGSRAAELLREPQWLFQGRLREQNTQLNHVA